MGGKQEQKGEGGNKEEGKKEEKTEVEKKNAPNSKGDNVVLGVYIHCEGCETKIKKSLRCFEGVEEVEVDRKNHKVIVKGKKLDPWKVLERVEGKTQKHVELFSPKVPRDAKEKVGGKAEATKKSEAQVIVVVLKVYMHCESCAHEVKKCAEKMEGVSSVGVDQKKSQMVVKGTFDPLKLVNFLYRRTGKHVEIVKQEKVDGQLRDKGASENREIREKNEGGKGELLFYYYPPPVVVEKAYPPLIFNDEDANSCSIM
ncbi:heavy metal-associated isoprenylated plant protein 8-like [Malania oleifera]|uniref:heavy metal-associated isoprenylated plant protein 8-like n=1 Tax=Malania oleifera TaxID=397392 RepID=UPI0025AE0ED9|nr:heavy metal-associated isoprenylated plant protein 8-like [Malania oleifera]